VDDCLKRQTASATPAKPGGFPWVAKAYDLRSSRFCLQLERNRAEDLAQWLAGKLWAILLSEAFSLLFRQMFKFSAVSYEP